MLVKIVFIIYCFFTSVAFSAFAGIVSIDDSFEHQRLIKFYEFYYDKEKKFDQDSSGIVDQKFSSSIIEHTGYFSGTMWARVTIDYDVTYILRYVISFDNYSLDDVVVYRESEGRLYNIGKTGESYAGSFASDLHLRVNIWPTANKDRTTYYFKVKAFDLLTFNSSIWSSDMYDSFKERAGLFFGLYYGIMLSILFVAYLFLYNFQKKKYRQYLYFFSVLIVLSMVIDGTASYVFSQTLILKKSKLIPLLITGAVVFAVISTIKLYTIKRKFIVQVGYVLIGISALGSLLSFFPTESIGHQVVNQNTLLCVLYILILSYDLYKKHAPASKYLLVAWAGYLAIQIYFFLSLYGIIIVPFPDEYINKFASLFLVSGISVAFFDIIKENSRDMLRENSAKNTETMIAGVAHEINNPLTIVAGNIEILKMQLEKLNIKDLMLEQCLSRQLLGVQRVSAFIEEIKSLSSCGRAPIEEVYVNQLIESVSLEVLPAEKGVTVKLSLDATVNVKILSSIDLRNVFVEILDNSYDALAEKVDNKKIIIESYIEHGDVVVIIQDNGRGMSQEEINKAFIYFYTTKPPSKKPGQGLGLPVVENVLSAMGGSIKLMSKEGEWTRVIVRIPSAKR